MSTPSITNLYAGPAILPVDVIRATQEALRSFRGTGIGIMEISHRSKEFLALIEEAKARLLRLLECSEEEYEVLFCTGGATQQFSMVPMNFGRDDAHAAYLVSGVWAEKALQEAAKFCPTYSAGSSEGQGYKSLPQPHIRPDTSYLHVTSNNTIIGSQYHQLPTAPPTVPLVVDASSDFLSRPLKGERFDLIYASAQKNLGPSGITIVVKRKDFVPVAHETALPLMCDYRTFTNHNSLYNTPPTLPLFVVNEVLSLLEQHGGLAGQAERNRIKAALVYQTIDEYPHLYRGYVEPDARSLMNATLTLPNKLIENAFLEEAQAYGFRGLAGHRLLGGIRVNMYNALPLEKCEQLCEFIHSFASKH